MGTASDYTIEFYVTAGGECPVKEILDAMPVKHETELSRI